MSTSVSAAGGRRWQRWGPATGIAFVVLLVVGFILTNSGMPNTDDPARKWTEFYSDSGKRAAVMVGFFVLIVAALSFLGFVATIRTRVVDRAPQATTLGRVAALSGAVFVVVLLVAATAMATVAGSVSFGNAPVPSADFGRQFSQLGFALLLGAGGLSAALFVATTSRLGALSGVFGAGDLWLRRGRAVVVLGRVHSVPDPAAVGSRGEHRLASTARGEQLIARPCN